MCKLVFVFGIFKFIFYQYCYCFNDRLVNYLIIKDSMVICQSL